MPDDFSTLDFSQATPEVSNKPSLGSPESADSNTGVLDVQGLDFSKAELAPTSEVVFDEKRGKAFEVPAGQTARETEYTIGTQHEYKNPGDYFSLNYLGKLGIAAAKGVVDTTAQMPSSLMEVVRTATEVEPKDIPAFDINKPMIDQMLSATKGLFEVQPRSNDLPNPIGEAAAKMKADYDAWVNTLDLGKKPTDTPAENVIHDLTGVGGSVLSAVGLTVLTKRPEFIAPIFGMIDAGSTMQAGREAGVPVNDRVQAGAIVGAFTTITEGLGGLFTLRALTLDQGLKKVGLEVINNAIQEGSQQAAQEGAQTAYGIQKPDLQKSLFNIFYAAILGGIGGAVPAAISAHLEKHGAIEELGRQGVSPEAAKTIISKISEAALEDPKVVAEINDMIRYENSPHNLSPEERAKRFAEANQTFQDELQAVVVKGPQGPERSAAGEKVARGQALTPEEAAAFPELLRIQLSLDSINNELTKATDPQRIKQLKARKQAFLRNVTFDVPAATSTAVEVPGAPIASGADRSIVAEKVATGLDLTEEERTAMPDLAAISDELNLIDEQLAGGKLTQEQQDTLQSDRAGLIGKLTFSAHKAVDQTGDTSFDFGANVPQEAAAPAPKSTVEQQLLDTAKSISSEGSTFTDNPNRDLPGERAGILTPGSSDLSFDPDLAWAKPLGWSSAAKRKADIAILKLAVAGEKLNKTQQARLEKMREAWDAGQADIQAQQPEVKTERRLKQSTVDAQKAKLTERVTKAATLAERKRVREAAKLSAMNEKAKALFQKKHPEVALLESKALTRSLQRQAETAKQATVAEQQRAKGEAKGKALNEKAKEAYNGPAATRILESKALKRMHERMATIAREAARWKKNDILLKQKLIRAIKSGDIAGMLAADRKQIQELQKALPETKTLDALVDLNNRIQAIKKASREKFQAAKAVREAQHQQRYEYLLNSLGYASPEEVVKGAKTADTMRRDLGKELKLEGFTAKRVFRDLGNMFTEIFYKSHNRTFSEQIKRQAMMEKELEDIKKKNGVTAEELGQVFEYDGIRVQAQEALTIMAVQSNPQHRAAIVEANKIPVETVEKIIAGMSPKMQALAADLAGWYDSHFMDFAAAVADVSNGSRDLSKVKGVYMPMFRQFDSPGTTEQDIESMVTEDFDRRVSHGYPGTPGPVKERVVQSGGGPGQIELRAFDVAYKYARIASTYIEMQRNLNELARLINEPRLRIAVENTHGKAYMKYLDNYLLRIANPSSHKETNVSGVAARVLREHASVMYIAGNLMTLAKQPLAIGLYLGNNGIGPAELSGSIAKFISDPKAAVQFMLERDPQMAHRAISREATEQEQRMKLVAQPKSTAEKFIQDKTGIEVPKSVRQATTNITNLSFQGLNWIQTQVDAIGWHAAYDKAVLMGKSELEAQEAGQAAVLETQNATSPKDSAPIFYTSDTMDLLVQFTDQLNKMYNIAFADVPHNWKNGDKGAAAMAVMGLVSEIVLERILASGKPPEDDEDWYKLALSGAGNLIPIIGPTATSIYFHYNGAPAGLSAPGAALDDIAKATEAVHDGDYEKAFQKILRPIAFVLKLPYPKSSAVRIKDILDRLANLES